MQEISEPLSIPLTVIRRFLGSSKTILLSSLLKNKKVANTAVVINEFDEVGLDHLLVEHSRGNNIELENGHIYHIIAAIYKNLTRSSKQTISRRYEFI